jgi:hypothetical protein
MLKKLKIEVIFEGSEESASALFGALLQMMEVPGFRSLTHFLQDVPSQDVNIKHKTQRENSNNSIGF